MSRASHQTRGKQPQQPRQQPRRAWLLAALALVALAVIFLWRQWQAAQERQHALDLARKGRFADAEPTLRRLHERDPEDLTVLIALTSGIIAGGGLLSDTEALLTRWCELQPTDPAPFRLRLTLWLGLKHYDRALADSMKLLDLEPSNDVTRRHVVELLLVAERFEEAERECRRALARAPDDPGLIYLLASLRNLQGQRAEAIELLQPLLTRQPPYAPALVLRGELHLQASPAEAEQAAVLLRQALDTDDEHYRRSAHYQLSQALALLGKHDEADQVLKRTRREQEARRFATDSAQQPDNLALQVRAAEALLGIGEAQAAATMMQRVLSRDPGQRAAHRVLADSYEKLGQAELAQKHRRAAEGRP
jgi:predicted Zn-dependent protease